MPKAYLSSKAALRLKLVDVVTYNHRQSKVKLTFILKAEEA